MKTSELTGPALDWAVSKCMTGGEIYQSGRVAHAVVLHSVGGDVAPYFVKDSGLICSAFEPSTAWAQGGPIIERERIAIEHCNTDNSESPWSACSAGRKYYFGPTTLIAAMRCFVASTLGDLIDIPTGLL